MMLTVILESKQHLMMLGNVVVFLLFLTYGLEKESTIITHTYTSTVIRICLSHYARVHKNYALALCVCMCIASGKNTSAMMPSVTPERKHRY